MKQFNLDKYLKNPSKKVVTRDGYPAKIICTNFHLSGYPIVAEINDKNYRNKQSWSFDKNGQFDSCKNNGKDLFFATEKKEGWVNIIKSSKGVPYVKDTIIFSSRERAETQGKDDSNYVSTVKIEW